MITNNVTKIRFSTNIATKSYISFKYCKFSNTSMTRHKNEHDSKEETKVSIFPCKFIHQIYTTIPQKLAYFSHTHRDNFTRSTYCSKVRIITLLTYNIMFHYLVVCFLQKLRRCRRTTTLSSCMSSLLFSKNLQFFQFIEMGVTG